MAATLLIRSIPALAAHLRGVHRMATEASAALACPSAELVPTYHPAGLARCRQARKTPSQLQAEAEAMVHVYRRLIDHMHRLPEAFREWREFDPGPFFDLYPRQAAALVQVDAGARATRVAFYGDLLMPAFQLAESYFVNTFAPAYRSAFARERPPNAALQAHYRTVVEPEMARRWHRLVMVAQRLNWTLQDDLEFMVVVDGADALFEWRHVWQEPAAPGLHISLRPAWETLTTFTLAVQCRPAPARPAMDCDVAREASPLCARRSRP